MSGDYAYIADGTYGLAVIQIRKRIDMKNPIISNSLSNFTVEAGYTGQSLSWTATDANPDIYTIVLPGSGIVAGSTVWTSGYAINYNIPNEFSVGSYIYTDTFTDDFGLNRNSYGDDEYGRLSFELSNQWQAIERPLRTSILLCPVCFQIDKDMILNHVRRKWFCIECYKVLKKGFTEQGRPEEFP